MARVKDWLQAADRLSSADGMLTAFLNRHRLFQRNRFRCHGSKAHCETTPPIAGLPDEEGRSLLMMADYAVRKGPDEQLQDRIHVARQVYAQFPSPAIREALRAEVQYMDGMAAQYVGRG